MTPEEVLNDMQLAFPSNTVTLVPVGQAKQGIAIDGVLWVTLHEHVPMTSDSLRTIITETQVRMKSGKRPPEGT